MTLLSKEIHNEVAERSYVTPIVLPEVVKRRVGECQLRSYCQMPCWPDHSLAKLWETPSVVPSSNWPVGPFCHGNVVPLGAPVNVYSMPSLYAPAPRL